MNYGVFLYPELIFLLLVSFLRLLLKKKKSVLWIQENSWALSEPAASFLDKYAIRQKKYII